ncbi:CehA/McbA family metallohydrolase [bacterium]|nr:CehA/McbA family metallohydrolase [bacterium]
MRIEFKNPFKKKGNWYKGNLHLHTTNSDGTYTPEEICALYKEAGYDFISITDHNKVTEVKEISPSFLVIKGAELNKDDFHVVAVGLKKEFIVENFSYQEIIDEINRRKAYSIVAHPYWSGLTSSDLLKLKNYIGIEVYNNTCEKIKGKGYSSVHWDELLQKGEKIFGFASDDAHHHLDKYKEDDALGSFIMVKATSLSEKSILNSIKNGYFYSSTGPIIENIEISENTIYIKTSPVKHIDFISFAGKGSRFSGKRKLLKEIEYKIKGDEEYIRIEITDKRGKKAWTNPVYKTC